MHALALSATLTLGLVAALLVAAPPAGAASLPGRPTNVTGKALDAAVALTWTAPSYAGSSPITGYRYRYSSDSGKTWSSSYPTQSTTPSYTVTSLKNGTSYVFQVRAVSQVGAGWWSVTSPAVTPAASTVSPTPSPSPTPSESPSGGSGGVYGTSYNMDTLANMQVGGPASGASNTYVSYRFRAERSEPLSAFRAMWIGPQYAGYGGGTGGTIRVTLETDNAGVPSGTVLASYTHVPGTSAAKFPLLSFPSPATLTAGTLYHLVFTNIDPSPTANYISMDLTYVYGKTLSPRQPSTPDVDFAALRKMGTGSWSVQGGYTPILDLAYASGTHQGRGYMEVEVANKAVIAGSSSHVRERFTLSGGDRVVTGAAVRIAKTSGTGDLVVRLEDSAGTLIDSFSVPTSTVPTLTSGDSPSGVWVTGSFSTPRTLTNGATYNLRLSTDSATSLWTRGIQQGDTYGFHKSTYFADGQLQITTNAGSTWTTVPGLSTSGDLQFYLH